MIGRSHWVGENMVLVKVLEFLSSKIIMLGESSAHVLRVVQGWMDIHPSVYVMFVPPLFRTNPTYKEDASAFMVRILIRDGDGGGQVIISYFFPLGWNNGVL